MLTLKAVSEDIFLLSYEERNGLRDEWERKNILGKNIPKQYGSKLKRQALRTKLSCPIHNLIFLYYLCARNSIHTYIYI